MDEKDFELLEVLDETRNITHAADKLYMTQSALSKRIKSMEQELGVEILLRSRQGIRFTPAGEKVLEHSRAALKQMEQLRRGLDAMQGEVCGTLKAGVSVNFSYYRLPEVLTEYHKKYPRVRLDIATGHSRHLYQQMLDGTLDIAVLRGEYPWDGTQFLLSQEDICLIYAREYEGKPLSDYLYIDHQTDASLGAQMARWRYENGVTGDTGSFVVDNITACLEMVKRGLGWALMPEIALDNFDGCVRPCTFETASRSSAAPTSSASGMPLLCRRCSCLWTCSRKSAERRKFSWNKKYPSSRCWMPGSAGSGTSRSCWKPMASRWSALP